jgi:hypothetical protein
MSLKEKILESHVICLVNPETADEGKRSAKGLCTLLSFPNTPTVIHSQQSHYSLLLLLHIEADLWRPAW